MIEEQGGQDTNAPLLYRRSSRIDCTSELRVLYLINDLRLHGGAEVALANVVGLLNRSRLEIWVGCLFANGLKENRWSLPSKRIVSFNFSHRFYADWKGLLRLVRFLRLHRIQVIHTHLFAANTVGRIAARLAEVPIVISTEHNVYLTKPRWAIWTDRILSKFTTQLVAVSGAVRAFAARQANVSLDRFVIIPNGIRVDEIPELSRDQLAAKRSALRIQSDQSVVLSVGRLTRQKGFDVLLNAAKDVLEKHPRAVFLIVGIGHLERELRERISELRLGDSIRLLGFRDDVYEIMQVSLMFVMSSFWEGLPVSLLEASACRLPIVASSVGGVPEVVRDGETGLLVPPEDHAALGACITRLLDSPALCRQMGEEGRRFVERHFSASSVAHQMESLYRGLWQARRAVS